MTVEVIDFGCRLNLAEGEAIKAELPEHEDIVVINSCAVTAEATRQARQAIRRAARAKPDARIVVTGCAVETQPEMFAGLAEIVPNRAKRDISAYFPELAPAVSLIRPAVSDSAHTRAFIEVQNGCDHSCTFCTIPLGRGENRSFPAGAVIDAVNAALARGQQEVILTGVDLTSYGRDLPGQPQLGRLVERILMHAPALPRLRLSTLDPAAVDPLLQEIIVSEQRVMPHIHLSLQSGNTLTLKRMKRRHSREAAIALVQILKSRRAELAIGADIIAGFPTESEEMFANSQSVFDACDIVFGHVFPYSPRPGTPAARMPQLPRTVVRERAAKLRETAAVRKAAWLGTLVGTTQRVLIERDGSSGHAPNFATVRLDQPAAAGNMRGTMVDVRITQSNGDSLTGVRV